MEDIALGNANDASEEILRKTQEIQAIVARIHKVRFDETREAEDVSRTIKNLVMEMKRLDNDLNNLKKRQLSELESTLKLAEIGLPSHLLSDKPSAPQAGSAPRARRASDTTAHLDDLDHMTEEEQQHLKLMRTSDTSGSLEGQPAKHKWQSLFKMFQEWKRETSIAQGQYALRSDSSDVIEQEINKVRAAILSLQHKKTLPPSEQELLSELQHHLQKLLQAQRAMANS